MDPYRERVWWPGWLLLAIGFVLVAGLAAVAASRDKLHWGFTVGAAPILLVGYVIWRMRFLDIEFGPAGVGFGFGGIHRRVPRSRIVGAEAKRYPVARYMGWGFRLGWEPRERAYSIMGCPRGVFVTFDDERGRRWKVFLSTREPEKALAALQA